MLKYMTAGESHGSCLVAILQGMPHGVRINPDLINEQLKRRQSGYGRGKRMQIESDKVRILSGLRKGLTIASPITLVIDNKDKSLDTLAPVICPRPGHADLAGMLKYNTQDARDILERASARETAARVAVGSVCRQFLSLFSIDLLSHIKALAGVEAKVDDLTPIKIKTLIQKSELSCADKNAQALMKKAIDKAKAEGDTVGGIFEVIALGVPAGLGSCMDREKKLDARLGLELFSIQAIKAISFGRGFEASSLRGSRFHDAIYFKNGRFLRKTNNAGGIEGGMTNGEPIRVSCVMKPISTLMNPLDSVNIKTKNPQRAATERSDTCALFAAGVVAENVAAIVLAGAFLEKFGSDSLTEIKRNYLGYIEQVKRF
ncbi:MAG: chorismate synthase [Candidatus Omnitrophota bacterium]